MAGNTCTCGCRFIDGEDWRDHMPCPGSRVERQAAERERDAVCAWLRRVAPAFGDHYAQLIEASEHLKGT